MSKGHAQETPDRVEAIPESRSLIDLFAGAGGFSLGFAQAGFSPVLGVDDDQRAISAYSANFPGVATILGDVGELTGSEMLDSAGVDSCGVVVGGPPCAAFSMGGFRNADDDRSELVFEFGRVVREVGPMYFVMENVPGILVPPFDAIIERFRSEMRTAGYQVTDPWVLDASDFGVPQRRRRVFLVGAKDGSALPVEPAAGRESNPTVKDAIGDLETLEGETPGPDGELTHSAEVVSAYVEQLRRLFPENGESQHSGVQMKLTGCARVEHSEDVAKRFESVCPGEADPVSRFHRLHPDRTSPTIRAGTLPARGSHTAPRPIHYRFPRCITVREAARLQSFPDWFLLDSTKWRGFMQVGNAVPPLLGQAVADSIDRAISQEA